jgi:uncharacterized membrane protein YcfT
MTGPTRFHSVDDMTSASPAATPHPRSLWPDVAKGMCILLVVLWHVVTKHYQQVDWDVSVPVSAAWGTLGEQLLPLRMPLFFTISGMFALGALGRSWPQLVRTRIGAFAALYAVWVVIHTAVMWFTPDFDTARARGAGALVVQLTVTPTNLWYLYALAVYFFVARLTRRVPTGWLLGAAFVLSAVAAAHLLPVPSNRGQVYQNLFFFLAGLRLRHVVERHARTTTCTRLAIAAGAYVAASAAMTALGAERWVGLWPVVSILAVGFGVSLAASTARLRRTSALLGALGRRTLPVYVVHLPLLALVDRLLDGPLDMLEPHGLALALVEPLLLTALLVALSLALHRVLVRLGLGRLFTVPRPTPRRVVV